MSKDHEPLLVLLHGSLVMLVAHVLLCMFVCCGVGMFVAHLLQILKESGHFVNSPTHNAMKASAGYHVRSWPFILPPHIPTPASGQTAFTLLVGFILALALIFASCTADLEP